MRTLRLSQPLDSDPIEMLTRLLKYKPGVQAIGQAGDTCLGIVTTEMAFKALPSPRKLV